MGDHQSLLSTKTSLESSTRKTMRSDVFWGILQEKNVRFNHQGVDGQTLVVCMDPKGQRRGGLLTHNISPWPNDAAVCSLSRVLERGSIPQKYYLSARACAGILRRAEKRGKKLPALLHQALTHIAQGSEASEQTVETTGGGLKISSFGIDGEQNATEEFPSTLRSHQSGGYEGARVLCISTGQAGAEIGIGIGTTLNCNHEAPIVAFNWNAQPDQGTPSLTCSQGAAVCQYGDVAGSLTARHDSSPCADRGMNVIAFAQNSRDDVRLIGGDGQIVGALAAEPGVKQQCYIAERSPVVAFKPGSSADARSIGAQEGIACTLESGGGGNNKQAVAYGLTVRRLMPVECELLQGMPRNHTAIPGAADGPRYKSIGNSKAVPCVTWLGQRISRSLS
jgi:hypothetical protein